MPYDAMTARRSYQAAKSPREALRELSRNAGSQFDPRVVRAFLDISAQRLRRLTGPLAMLAQIPLVAGLQRVAEWAGTATVGTAAVAAAVATGIIAPLPTLARPLMLRLPLLTTTTIRRLRALPTTLPSASTIMAFPISADVRGDLLIYDPRPIDHHNVSRGGVDYHEMSPPRRSVTTTTLNHHDVNHHDVNHDDVRPPRLLHQPRFRR